jgi:DNA polymerase-3 subunit alpha
MGFPGYFLIVADFINWAKHNGCPVGPGRGSGAGSVVAYALGITDLDPLRYALLFERFLNPERVSMPDFDIDFCQDNRWRVIEYVRQKYGAAAVSQIVTFGTMSSKAVIRDVGRVLDLPYNFCDQLSKLIPVETNKPLSLAKAIAAEPQLKARIDDEEEVRNLFDLAARLEDLTRNVGMHAGGVLIAPGKLTDFCPVYSADGGGSVVSQYDKDDVEKVGLVKFDFLGLRNLTIIKLALDYVEKLSGQRPDLTALSFDDPLAYQILKDGNTTAIFQVESEGMKKLVRKLAPDRFEDIIAVLALYRPGPLGSGMVDDFILRKKGQQKIDYYIDDLKVCLEPTYGVIVYQEQVMQIAQIIGGYTLGAADLLRRAMGKKKAEEMALHRDLMREGAKKKGYDEKLAMQLFDLMEKFAEYGFNKSHTAAYAVVTYHTAWLKAHHCAAFMAATLSSDMDNTDTVKIVHDDALANGLRCLARTSMPREYRFTPVDRSAFATDSARSREPANRR